MQQNGHINHRHQTHQAGKQDAKIRFSGDKLQSPTDLDMKQVNLHRGTHKLCRSKKYRQQYLLWWLEDTSMRRACHGQMWQRPFDTLHHPKTSPKP